MTAFLGLLLAKGAGRYGGELASKARGARTALQLSRQDFY
jgi:hypothetical protein